MRCLDLITINTDFKMKHAIYIFLIIAASTVSFILGRYDWYKDVDGNYYPYSMKDALIAERQYCNACLEGLHWWYRQNTNWWDFQFKISDEYKKIEEANQGDWEDFYSPNWK